MITRMRATGMWPRIGFGQCCAHWGELVQGPIIFNGNIITALITLPRTDKVSQAIFFPDASAQLHVEPDYATRSAVAAKMVLARSGNDQLGGTLAVSNNIGEAGCGAGTSTSDVTASVKAVADSIHMVINCDQIQEMVWQVERASDPLVLIEHKHPVVYGSRTGQIIETLPSPIPKMNCLAFNAAPGVKVYTDALKEMTAYSAEEVCNFAPVLAAARTAILEGRTDQLATAALESARLNQHRVPIRNFDAICSAAARAGALGVSVAHSGTLGAALFEDSPIQSPIHCRAIAHLARVLHTLGCTDIELFAVGGGQWSARDAGVDFLVRQA